MCGRNVTESSVHLRWACGAAKVATLDEFKSGGKGKGGWGKKGAKGKSKQRQNLAHTLVLRESVPSGRTLRTAQERWDMLRRRLCGGTIVFESQDQPPNHVDTRVCLKRCVREQGDISAAVRGQPRARSDLVSDFAQFVVSRYLKVR